MSQIFTLRFPSRVDLSQAHGETVLNVAIIFIIAHHVSSLNKIIICFCDNSIMSLSFLAAG